MLIGSFIPECSPVPNSITYFESWLTYVHSFIYSTTTLIDTNDTMMSKEHRIYLLNTYDQVWKWTLLK